MIVRANITKVINGKLYLKVRDEAEMWDILDNELYTDDDVIWEESYNEPVYTEDVDPVRLNSKGEYELDIGDDEDEDDFEDEDEEESRYINTCQWEDGCGGCPYFDDCALTQTGSWYR